MEGEEIRIWRGRDGNKEGEGRDMEGNSEFESEIYFAQTKYYIYIHIFQKIRVQNCKKKRKYCSVKNLLRHEWTLGQ